MTSNGDSSALAAILSLSVGHLVRFYNGLVSKFQVHCVVTKPTQGTIFSDDIALYFEIHGKP